MKKIGFWALMVPRKEDYLLIFKESAEDSLTGFLTLTIESVKDSKEWQPFLNGRPIKGLFGAISTRSTPFTMVLNREPVVNKYVDKETGETKKVYNLLDPHKDIVTCE